MLSAIDLERLIAEKKLEIENEKTVLGFASLPRNVPQNGKKDNISAKPSKKLNFQSTEEVSDDNAAKFKAKKEIDNDRTEQDFEENIPPDLERYIRRYIGLPVMLKAGEYSPNNPFVRCERSSGDVLLALGEYERRRNTLRRMRQQQYREYLDQQAKKKQEAKEKAEREQREREEKEREREEKKREREEREREHEEREREREEREREQHERERRLVDQERRRPDTRRSNVTYASTLSNISKKDTGVQVENITTPLSVAVQTEDADILRLASSKYQLTQAERELSPHAAADRAPSGPRPRDHTQADRRRSYGHFDERSIATKKSNRDKLTSDLRHTYMPSIFDADAIQLRNIQAEKEAAARRQYYQQELKNQIMEQQRIKEERKSREKMLEQAEMRRLEEHLKMLRVAQEHEVDKQHHIDNAMENDAIDYQKRRIELQKEIDVEQQKLRAPLIQHIPAKRADTSKSEDIKVPALYPRIQERFSNMEKKPASQGRYFTKQERKPFSLNIPDNSIFSPNYDVDSYLRKNLNFKDRYDYDYDIESIGKERNIERALVHERPIKIDDGMQNDRKKFQIQDPVDSLPVLKDSPLMQSDKVESDLSDAMRKVNDKWKVPVVQKNILKSVPNDDGKNVSILTQLGSIRRQLQLEQLRLDQMSKDE